MTQPEQTHHHVAGSWNEVDQDSQRFRALLHKYRNDYQKATDAYLRGEEADVSEAGGSENPM